MSFPVLTRFKRAEYIDPPALIKKRTSAKRRGWHAGWPDNCPSASARVRVEATRPSDGKVFGVTVDARVAEVFGLWMASCMALGHELRGKDEPSVNGKFQGGLGSYVCRAIKGSNPPRPSNHSSATAVDSWTRSNPQVRDGRFVSTVHPEVVELAGAADLYWGGWYFDTSGGTYVDSMHFEYMRRPADVANSVAKLKAKYAEIKKRHEPDPEEPVKPEQVMLLQKKLNELGTQPPLTEDGVFGQITEDALRRVTDLVHELVDDAEVTGFEDAKAQAVAAVEAIQQQ